MNKAYLIQSRRQLLVFARILAGYGCAGNGETVCGTCSPCEARQWLEERNLTGPQRLPALNERETEVLRELLKDNQEWLRPMDCGGTDSSDHSRVLQRLVIKGYVEMKPWGGLALAAACPSARPCLTVPP